MEFYEQLSPKMKGVFSLSVLGIAVAGAVYGILQIKKLADSSDERKEGREWGKESKKDNKNNSTKQSLSDAQILAIANSIHTTLDGCGTYEIEVVAEFSKLKTNGDFSALQDTYGSRSITCWGVGGSMTLTPSLISELSQYWRDRINKALKGNGITYTV